MITARQKARREILVAANKARASKMAPPFYMRHLQRAVCMVRRQRLVSNDVLVTAGFNASTR